MKKQTKAPRRYRVYLEAPEETSPRRRLTTRILGQWVDVQAVDKPDAKTQALLAHRRGKVDWKLNQGACKNLKVEAADVRLLVPETVLDHYMRGTPRDAILPVINRGKTTNPQGTYFGFQMRRAGPQAVKGTPRYDYDDNGYLYSYNMAIAYRTEYKGKPMVIVNGDGAPTRYTNVFMGMLQLKLRPRKWDYVENKWVPLGKPLPHAFIPFSVLRRAGLQPSSVTVLDTTPDNIVRVKLRRKDRATGEVREVEVDSHFLGETLFEAHGKVYVCGLDRNDDPRRRMFYMCRIPVPRLRKEWPKSVDAALKLLRPPGLPKTALRQGEWFFVPEPDFVPDEKSLRGRRIPIISATALEQGECVNTDGTPSYAGSDREGRHVASSMCVDTGNPEGAVHVKGQVLDREHTKLKLGPVWHRVVKNRAMEGWRYVPTGPARGSRVD